MRKTSQLSTYHRVKGNGDNIAVAGRVDDSQPKSGSGWGVHK